MILLALIGLALWIASAFAPREPSVIATILIGIYGVCSAGYLLAWILGTT